jgi:hypothetical protein
MKKRLTEKAALSERPPGDWATRDSRAKGAETQAPSEARQGHSGLNESGAARTTRSDTNESLFSCRFVWRGFSLPGLEAGGLCAFETSGRSEAAAAGYVIIHGLI